MDLVVCPSCGQEIEVEREAGKQIVQCPNCKADVFPSIEDESLQSDAESGEFGVDWPDAAEANDELDGMRIRKMVQLRRAAIRARTYAVVIMLCCLVMAVQLILTDVQEVRYYGWDRWAILYAISAGFTVIGAAIASGRAAMLQQETHPAPAPRAEQPPHFETLSDGSQQVGNLERMQHVEDNG